MQIIFRPLTGNDLPELRAWFAEAELSRRLSFPSDEWFAYVTVGADDRCWVALDASKIIAAIQVYRENLEVGYLDLAVRPSRLADLKSQISILEDQKAAFEKVIQFYDPAFRSPGSMVMPKPKRTSSWNSSSGRVTELLRGRNNRHIVLDILRRCKHPSSAADIAKQFSLDEELGEEAERLHAALTTRFSGTLDGLLKQGLVSQAVTVDGRQNLWEVNRQSGGTPRTQT